MRRGLLNAEIGGVQSSTGFAQKSSERPGVGTSTVVEFIREVGFNIQLSRMLARWCLWGGLISLCGGDQERGRVEPSTGGVWRGGVCAVGMPRIRKASSCLMGDLVDEMNEKRSCSSSH
jgi:hypothetical protein